MRRKAGVGDSVPRGFLGESAILVVDEEEIRPVLRLRPYWTGNGDVDVQVAVVVDVHHRHAGCPSIRRDTRLFRDVLEPHVPLVQIQAARDHVAGKENVRQSVVIDVAYPTPAPL